MLNLAEIILSEEEKEYQRQLNRDNKYEISSDMMARLTSQFEAAETAAPQDTRTMAKILFRMSDINLHHAENKLMAALKT